MDLLRFILGRSGTGKSREAINIASKLSDSGENVMLVVPDQSTFECEKTLLDRFKAKKAESIMTFGFSRLCDYVFELTGNTPKNVIDDGTKAVIMSLALEELSEKLTLLSVKNKKSLVNVMLATLENMKKSDVTSEALRTAAASASDKTLRQKLRETALTADTFDALIAQSYIDPLDDLSRLCMILTENPVFDNFTVIFDGFSGFTAAQLKVVRLLVRSCRRAYVTLTLDPFSSENEEVFATAERTRKILSDYAKRDGVEIKAPVKLKEPLRFKNDELKILEKNIFRAKAAESGIGPQNIVVYRAADIYDECDFTARKIKCLVMKDGYLYSDISVICRDAKPYRGVLAEALERYEIPFFDDRKTDIEVKPVIRLVNSVFRIIIYDFEREDVLSLLKTGLTAFSSDEINEFENYLFIWNISGCAFKNRFSQNPKGYSESFSSDDKLSLERLENMRKAVTGPLIGFKSEAKDKTVLEISRLFYALLENLGVPEALQKMCAEFESIGDAAVGTQQIRVWNLLMQALDKTVSAAGNRTVSPKKYYELLSFQISAMKLSEIPRTVDCVTVTTAQRVRVSRQRASFLIGCVDGVFPAAASTSGIFSPYELGLLALDDLKLGEDVLSQNELELFMAYCCVTSASEKLFVSYYSRDLSGGVCRPSDIAVGCASVFPELTVACRDENDAVRDSMLALRPAFDTVVRFFGKGENIPEELTRIISSNSEYAEKFEAVKRAADKKPFEIKQSETADALFGKNPNVSASQIEKFNLCGFSYFCGYGLKAKERLKAEINPLEYGTLVHRLLDRFFAAYDKSGYSSMTHDEIEKNVGAFLGDYAKAYFGERQLEDKSFEFRLKTISENAVILLEHLVKELSQSDFHVADCELNIGKDIPAYSLALPDGRRVTVYGSVDRVDIMEKDGRRYLRVIDYKTGAKKFALYDILYGLNLQMLLYLHSIEKTGKRRYGEIIPAGILYMPAKVKPVAAEKLGRGGAETEIGKELKMNGLLLDDPDVIHSMDKTDKGTYISVKPTDCESGMSQSLATLAEMGKIFKKVDMLIADMASKLHGGKIAAEPCSGAHDSCEYCPYDSVCAYRKNKPRYIFSDTKEDVFKEIERQAKESGDKTDE